MTSNENLYCACTERIANGEWSKDLENSIELLDDPVLALEFAQRNHPNSNIKMLQKIIEKHNDPVIMYHFAMNAKEADIKRLEDAIIESGDAEMATLFARDVERANLTNIIESLLINYPRLIEHLFRDKPELIQKYREEK